MLLYPTLIQKPFKLALQAFFLAKIKAVIITGLLTQYRGGEL